LIVSSSEILAALQELEVSKKEWTAAKKDSAGADIHRLAYQVMRHLRQQDGADPRWAQHGRSNHCRLYSQPSRVGALCKCPLWRPVVELTRDILKNEPRPAEDEELEEESDNLDSQTESVEA
jgi:hypothetical protein